MENRLLVKELITVSMLHRCKIASTASKSGLYYGQPMILEFIHKNKFCSQIDIANALRVTPASVATSLSRLEKAKLVKRTPDKANTRKNRLSLTESGEKALLSFISLCDDTDAELFKGFSAEDIDTLYSLLCRLHENLETDGLHRDIHKITSEIKKLENGGKTENV